MYEYNFDFNKDFDEIIAHELTTMGYRLNPAENSEKLRFKYFNLKRRLVSVKPRKIYISKEFYCPSNLQIGLNLLITKFENGLDVSSHLSKKVSKLKKRDTLLDDWGIHHFHLGEKLNGKFAKRDGPLLFARIEEDRIFFLNIFPHGVWSNQQMVRIIHDNWPESIKSYRIKDAIGVLNLPDDQDIVKLRQGGIAYLMEIYPSIVYMPIGGGLCLTGRSAEIADIILHYRKFLENKKQQIENNIEKIFEVVNKQLSLNLEKLNFKLICENGEFKIIEEVTNSIINFV